MAEILSSYVRTSQLSHLAIYNMTYSHGRQDRPPVEKAVWNGFIRPKLSQFT